MVISLQQVSKVYKSQAQVVKALDGLDLVIKQGECLAISGASGSGKSTLLNIIGMLDNLTSGDILYDQTHINEMSVTDKAKFRREYLGFVFQSFNLIPVLTVYENIELAFKAFSKQELTKFDKIPIKERIEKVLEDVGLSGYENRKPNQLSGGQMQRVAIARAIVKEPHILLADEPTANLDSENSKNVINLFLKLNEQYGHTIILSSHEKEVITSAHRVITLQDGKIIGDDYS